MSPARTVIFRVTYRGPLGMSWRWKVSRVIELLETQTLIDLHETIQDSIGWTDPHLFSFFMDGKAWSEDKSKEYTCPEALEEAEDFYGHRPKTADVKIKDLNLQCGQRFLYIFDFGDDHRFRIEGIGFGEAKDSENYPKLLESKGKSPQSQAEEV